MRILVYVGGLLLVGALAWAVDAVLTHRSFALDNRCQQRALSCGILASFLVPVLTIALVSAFFLLGRLWYLRRRYLRRARTKPQDVVPTAGNIIGDVVGRDELCRVMIADVRDTHTRRPHVIVGGIGTGKTALLVRLAKLLAHQRAVPVAVRLRDARETLNFRELARERFIADLESSILSDDEGEKVWRQLLKEGRIVVLADGLEEALIDDKANAERDNLIRLAIRQAGKEKLPLIIASRPHDPLRGTEAAIVELEPLSEEAALDYIQLRDSIEDEHRLDWIVETADVTEAPLYLQIAHQLHRAGLLMYLSASRDDRQLDTRSIDRSELRVRLLTIWEDALIKGHFPPGVALKRDDRLAAIEHLSVLACIGLRQDKLEVNLEEFEALRKRDKDGRLLPIIEQPPIIQEAHKRLAAARHPSFDVRLAATWGTQLELVEARENAVRFPHSILQAYLGSWLIGCAMADAEFREEALKNAGRELLIALVMYSRAKLGKAGPRGLARADIDSSSSSTPADPIDLRTLLRDTACKRTDAKALNLYATVLEIDSVHPDCEHQAIAGEIAKQWQKLAERDPRTLEHAKLNLVRRFGEAARTITERRRTNGPAQPAYRQLFEIGCGEPSYAVRLTVAQEIGAGGDDALAELRANLGPPARQGQALNQGNGAAHAADAQQNRSETSPANKGQEQAEEKDEETQRQNIMRAWLAPLLVGSASGDSRAIAGGWLEEWLDFVYEQNRLPDRARVGLSLEIALAQGFKYAANRRRTHPQARDDARTYLAEQAKEMLGACHFWFTRITLLHALTLWHLPDGANGRPGNGPDPDYKALVAHWCGMDGSRRRNRYKEHPFVAETWRLCVRALETGQPERYIWIDESGVVSRVGSCPARPGTRRKHNLWIPPSTGWTALNAHAQQLVADVLLLLNLAERGGPSDRDRRLQRTNENYLPPCMAEDRSLLEPNRPLGMAGDSAPGSSCKAGCPFGLCPYPPKGSQHHRQELSEAFCRRQQRLLTLWPSRPRTAPWQEMSAARLRRFWRELGQPVSRTQLERDNADRARPRGRRR